MHRRTRWKSVSAGLGQANTVGRLSVPSAWTVAAPEIRPVAYTLPITNAAATPEIAAGSSGNLFSNMGLAGAAGGAVGSSASVGRGGDQRIRMTPRANPKPPQRPSEAVTEIAVELRELATRAQSLLAKLADSGLMNGRGGHRAEATVRLASRLSSQSPRQPAVHR